MSLLLPIIFLLAASLIFVPLAKRYLGTTVPGYLVAGLVLGSSVTGLVEDQQLIQSLLELGMISFMLFLGLAFRPLQLWQERRNLLKDSGLALALISLTLVATCFLIFNQLLASIIVGFALALSAVTPVRQLLQNKQQLHNSVGQASLATLQFQTFVTLILIVLFPLLEDTATTSHGIAYFAAIMATISGLFLASRYLVRPAFRFLVHKNSLHLIAALSLLVILSVILIMDILHIHILIGAFLAGLLLAETEFKAEVERIITPFKDAASGLFFLALGLGLSLQPLIHSPGLIAGSILGLILIKAGIIAAIHYYHVRHARVSSLMAVTLAQSGEFSFILLELAAHESLLPQPVLQPVLLIVFGSILLTPLLYWLLDTEILPRLQKKPVVAPEDVPRHPILIVGFGRFGQVLARALHAQGKRFSAIDSNQPEAVFIEQYGHRFIDADVSQPENLRAAGIEYCKLLILAIDDVEDSMNLARYLRLNHPDLTLFARARDRHHAHLLNDLGIQAIWRETYASSLLMAQQALIETGLSSVDAQTQIERFKQQDELLLIQQHWVHDQQDSSGYYSSAIAELEYLFENTKTLSPDRLSNDQNIQSDANSLNDMS